jgi:hypothetical protein
LRGREGRIGYGSEGLIKGIISIGGLNCEKCWLVGWFAKSFCINLGFLLIIFSPELYFHAREISPDIRRLMMGLRI